VQKEIDTRGKKIMPSELMQLRIVRGLVLEMTGKLDEAKAEVLGVLKEVKEQALADHYVLDTFLKTTQRMTAREEYIAEYLKVIEILHAKHPKDKELVFTLFNGALSNNQFSMAAKMASKMYQTFEEPSYVLPQVQCLYMDSQKWLGGSGLPISMQLAVGFAEKYMAAQQKLNEAGAPIPVYFVKLYLKLLLAKKDFAKAQTFLETEGKRSFDLWVEARQWQV
jgi:hypothetical protein